MVTDMTCPKECSNLNADLKEAVFDPVTGTKARIDKKISRKGFIIAKLCFMAIVATFIIYGMEANSQQKARIAESEIRVAETKKDVEINHDNIADMKEIMSGIQITQAQLARNQVVLMERQMDPKELLKSIAAIINKE